MLVSCVCAVAAASSAVPARNENDLAKLKVDESKPVVTVQVLMRLLA